MLTGVIPREFALQIETKYGPEDAQKFLKRFADPNAEITYEQALRTLDEVLLGDGKPIAPAFGRTKSPNWVQPMVPPELEVALEDAKLKFGVK